MGCQPSTDAQAKIAILSREKDVMHGDIQRLEGEVRRMQASKKANEEVEIKNLALKAEIEKLRSSVKLGEVAVAEAPKREDSAAPDKSTVERLTRELDQQKKANADLEARLRAANAAAKGQKDKSPREGTLAGLARATQLAVLRSKQAKAEAALAEGRDGDAKQSDVSTTIFEKEESETAITERPKCEEVTLDTSGLTLELDLQKKINSDLEDRLRKSEEELAKYQKNKAPGVLSGVALATQIAVLQAKLMKADAALAAAKAENMNLETQVQELTQELLMPSGESSVKGKDLLQLSTESRIGVTGKHYCGQKMENSECGLFTGSNCAQCQKLDLTARCLPRSYLVNGDGRIARRGEDGATWYCGAAVMQRVPGCTGFCGPVNGPNCRACQELQCLAERRYSQFI